MYAVFQGLPFDKSRPFRCTTDLGSQSGNLKVAPLQVLQLPTMVTSEDGVMQKLKIRIPLKRIEADPGTESYKLGPGTPANGKKKLVIKSDKSVIPSSGDAKVYTDADNLKVKSCTHKRKLSLVTDGQKEKRRKMDRSASRQCSIILKQLMMHPAGWVFNHPVDPVKLNIPDYHSIISDPMDLGTIKTKLEKNTYSNVEEFAADVWLTFSNAMVYNPPYSDVYHMAEQLNSTFNTRWNCFEARWNREHTNVEQEGKSRIEKDTEDPGHKKYPLHVNLLPKLLISAEEKEKLRKQLLELSREKISPHLQGLLKKCGLNWQRDGRVEIDIDAFDDKTLLELKRSIRSFFVPKPARAGSPKKEENSCRKSLGKIVHRGTADSGYRSVSGSATVNQQNSVAYKCGSCGTMRCQCSLQSDPARASSSDISSERSLGQDCVDSSRKNEVQSLLASRMGKSDPESDGAMHKEHGSSSPQLTTLGTTPACGEEWTPTIDIQLSPKKALRAAMLKSRFADTIFKAKHKTLLDHVDKIDPVKMQKEKERLERQQLEEAVRIEAQIKAAETASRMRAEAELKMQREREREAARLALQKIERTVEINNNQEILKDLEMLSGLSLSNNWLACELGAESVVGPIEGFGFGSPLERLGLFMKDEFILDEDEDAIFHGDGEEGEVFSNSSIPACS
ncbi:transcription factor GTE11-like isoform X3 [Rhododendron vialii]|uniref:transcription factor GTE11-like isoform X3 n=1 Tax=Rhododendron vialii TaxID=182163 RepID=UPI00265F932C|nr:transcription factor GTE11-like isoform X3 [Rhododendron vialii]